MIFLKLALKSLRNRLFSTTLTVFSIALSVTLLLIVERAKHAAEDGFTQSISKTDLIVGARSGPLQLVLYTVFNMGNATHNISYKTYLEIQKNPVVSWTIPYSLGDGHQGFRVVGTTADFFMHYHYRGENSVSLAQGKIFAGLWDVVIGSEVARSLKYKLDDKIIVEHGVTQTKGIHKHDDKPFRVVGVLNPTGTTVDRALYITLKATEAMHIDWHDGSAPKHGHETHTNEIHEEDIKIDEISAFFVGARSRIDTLRLQREINEYKAEPLLAIIPGLTLSELWHNLSYAENILKVISWMVVSVGFMAMLIALMTTLNERRREMAILRSIGASRLQILMLLVLESAVLTFAGIVLGMLLTLGLSSLLAPWLASEFGFYLTVTMFSKTEWAYLSVTLMGGVLIGFVPAWRALRYSLKDGLSAKI